ncbi:MAG: hypothetical protein ACFFBP_02330 [Promethearchaeota archaeon]
MKSENIKRNELYVFDENDSAYKVIKSILLDFFLTGFQSSNYVMNGLFMPESQEEADFVLQCLQSDFEDYFAKNFDTIINEINTRAKHLARMDLKKRYFKDIEDRDKLKKINKMKENEKVLTICPKCQKKILARDLDTSQIERFPFSYVDVHSHDGHPEHGLLVYIDAHGKCRGKGNIDFISID